jgi:hypothetical protein
MLDLGEHSNIDIRSLKFLSNKSRMRLMRFGAEIKNPLSVRLSRFKAKSGDVSQAIFSFASL